VRKVLVETEGLKEFLNDCGQECVGCKGSLFEPAAQLLQSPS